MNGKEKADACIVQKTVWVQSIFEASDASEDKTTRGSRLFIWDKYRNKTQQYPYDILESKLHKKFKQTKVDDRLVGRILLVHMPFGFYQSAKEKHQKLIQDATRNFENVSAIIITSKESGRGRFMYNGVVLGSMTGIALPPNVLEKLNLIETMDLFD